MRNFLFLCIVLSVAAARASAEWPEIVGESQSFHIASPASQPPVDMVVHDVHGKVVYRLRCGSFDTPIKDFAFSGDFECYLQTVPPNYSRASSLFAEKSPESGDWQTRARFLATEVQPPCDRIPDFGAIRHFSLRGMDITLSMSNIRFTTEENRLRLRSFDFKISVRPDAAAKSALTMPPLVDSKWRGTSCVLDNSVTPHFEGTSNGSRSAQTPMN